MWVRAVGTNVSIGNPHFVIFVENFQEGWQRQAALIGTQPQFPQGTNVEYVVVRGANEIEIRLFERGVGETQSSGTGSCASAVAAIASRRVASPVTVIAPGGSQTVRWENQVYLRGAAVFVVPATSRFISSRSWNATCTLPDRLSDGHGNWKTCSRARIFVPSF